MSFDLKKHYDDFLFVPLGGSNEIGMNLNLYHYQGKWLMIDLGIGFADAHLPGVDVIVPDISFIMEHKKDIVGLVLTHAHEDHLGAVPYLWEELGCPVYATPFTSAFLKAKLNENGLRGRVKITEVEPGAKINLAPFSMEMVPLTHSIPEMQAIAIRTDKGVIMHTGDWKFDPDPLVGPTSDEAMLKRYGDEGVLAMVCDSTNVFVAGTSGSEAGVRENLVRIIANCPNRVAVTTFASNIARLETLIHAGHEAGRRIVLAGRSLWRIVDAGKQSGYLMDNIQFLDESQAMDIPKHEVMIICTGCQGEPLAALSKIARGEHQAIRFAPGDTVIFASRKIPGNEKRISWTQNNLTNMGIEVITDHEEHVHVSGHPARDELKRMYALVRPHIAIPTHGEARHIHEHCKFARSLGVPHTVEMRNGHVAKLCREQPQVVGLVESGYIAIDGNALIPVESSIFRLRRRLRDEGCVFVSIVMDKDGGLLAPPRMIAPGCMDVEEDRDLIEACVEAIAEELERMKSPHQDEKVQEAARQALRKIFKTELGKKPPIEIHVMRV